MAILHVINHTPSGGAPDARLTPQRVRAGDAVMLIEDGCYAARAGAAAAALLANGVRVLVLRADLEARGITAAAGVEVTDYDGFVDLSAACHPVISWR